MNNIALICLCWLLTVSRVWILKPSSWTVKGISYTYDTMKLLTEANPDTDYYFIIGADMVEYLPKWHRIDELIEMVQFVGVQRPKYKAGTSYPVIWVDVPLWILVRVQSEPTLRRTVHLTLWCPSLYLPTSRKRGSINDL